MQVLKGYRMAFFAKLLPKTASTDVGGTYVGPVQSKNN